MVAHCHRPAPAMSGRWRNRERVAAQLRRLPEAAARKLNAALFAAGDIVAAEAALSITRGAVSGKHHVPSAPGSPPNNDTGVLASGIVVTNPRPLVVHVTSEAPYSVPLEFGSSKTAARPFLKPARDRTKNAVKAKVAEAMSAVVRDLNNG